MTNRIKQLLSAALMTVMLVLGATPASAQFGTTSSPQGSTAYAIQQNGGLNQLVSFSLADPALTRVIGSLPAGIAADFIDHDFSTLYLLSAQNTLYRVDTASGKYHAVGKAEPQSGHVWTAMAWNPVSRQMVAVSVGSAVSRDSAPVLSLIDPNSGQVRRVTEIKTTGAVVALAVDGRTGTLYGVNANTDRLLQIEETTGKTQDVGYIGFDASLNNQSLDFDDATGALYYSATSAKAPRDGQLFVMDPASGSTQFIAAFGANILRDAFAVAGQ